MMFRQAVIASLVLGVCAVAFAQSLPRTGKYVSADWANAQRDEWNGAYRIDDTILAEGSRAFVASDGSIQVGSLGTQVFKLQN